MGDGALILHSGGPEQTAALGRALGELLQGGDCVALCGELGAGKTAFAAGVGKGLGVREPLRSPSYLLCCEHLGRVPALHLDAYFEGRLESLMVEGLAARFTHETVLLIEWADRLAAWWPGDRLEVGLSAGPEPEARTLTVRARGPRSAALVTAWAARLAPAGLPPEGL
jgi:tRNA threonylcarbamoyladenosine biosynthesis protein TsaE